MRVPTDDLNDLENDIGNLFQLLNVMAGILLDAPRSEREIENVHLDQATALTIVSRDMAAQMIEAMALCHARVLREAQARRKGEALQ